MGDSWSFGPPARKKRRGRRKAMIVGATLGVAMFSLVAVAQWITVSPRAGAKGYAKSSGLTTAFIDTVDVSASLTGDFSPFFGAGDCASDRSQCGDVSLQFSSTSPFPIHLSQVTFDVTTNFGPGNAACGVGIYPVDAVQALDITVPAGSQATPGQSSVVTFNGLVGMGPSAPETCADQVWFVPISGLIGTRA